MTTPRLTAIHDCRRAVEKAWAEYLNGHRAKFGNSRGAKAARTLARRALNMTVEAIAGLAVDELREIERSGSEIDWQGLRPRHSPPTAATTIWPIEKVPSSEPSCDS